jgi:glycosyltransferase involved in cell wall biosynthesis
MGTSKMTGNGKSGIVSILTLDRLGLTQKAVDSVLEHSVGDVRMVFLDNGSTDGTREYLEQLRQECPSRVTILKSDTNLGVARGRNEVFSHIVGTYGDQFKWILSLDNDCTVHKGYDDAITRSIEETRAQVICPRLIQPSGRPYYNAHCGFLVDLDGMKLKLEYVDDTGIEFGDPRVSERIETDVILGTSAKTPDFFDRVGFYDEGHKIGWEDFSIALRTLGLTKESFLKWRNGERSNGKRWVPLKELMNGENTPLAKVIYEPDCVITHDHPMTEEYKDYEAIRREATTIRESTNHFEDAWGVRPVSRRD